MSFASAESKRNRPPQIRVTIKGKVRDKYTVAIFKDSNGYLSEVTGYSKDDSNKTKTVEVVTGVKTKSITKTRVTAQPTYEAIADAMNDPNLQVEVLKANYEEYNNNYNDVVEKNNVEVEIDFIENLILNKYDVKLSIYDQEVNLPHGQNKTFNLNN